MDFSARRIFFSGFVFWIIVAAAALYFSFPLRDHLKFGIDLVGGTYITLDVQVEKAVEYELLDKLHSIPTLLKEAEKEAPVSSKVENNSCPLSKSYVFIVLSSESVAI